MFEHDGNENIELTPTTSQPLSVNAEAAGASALAACATLAPMKKIDIEKAPARIGSMYPEPYDVPCRQRVRRRLGAAANLTGFGVNLCRLPPGTWSSQRHWHTREDEFIYVVEGEVVLVTDAGEEVLKPGDCAGFKAGDADGHHLQNRSDKDAVILEVGTNADDDVCEYPGLDLRVQKGAFVHRDGQPYPAVRRQE